MKKKGMMKRFACVCLVFAISFSYHVQTLADAQNSGTQASQIISYGNLSRQAEEEMESARRKSSPLYNQLIQTSGKPKKPFSNLTGDAEWAEEYRQQALEQEIGGALDVIKDEAEKKIETDWKRTPDLYDSNAAMSDLANTIESFGSFMGLTDALSKFPEVLNLQGETVQQQLLELTVLTAEFGVAAFSIIGISIGFPWGLILSLTLDMILDMIRKGVLDDLFPDAIDWREWFERQRYKLPDGTNVYKPNIYIYSQEEREVSVIFEEPQLLTATIPEYGDGWQVTADKDGRLTDMSGTDYGYLFYESMTEASIFELDAGWRIPADARKACFEEILGELGFNEQETADFTEFWTNKLEESEDYIMYPQGTGLVDLAMPVSIEEEPDSLERRWFVFVKDDGRQVKAPTGYELSRGGEGCSYYVIEWGGLILEAEKEFEKY